MKNTILSFINSYENMISTFENITALDEITRYDENIISVDKERERLGNSLQEILAKNCSLRKKDFNSIMERILYDVEEKKEEIQQKQRQIKGILKDYLDEQRKLATFLKEKLTQFAQSKSNEDGLKAILADMKALHEHKGQQVLSRLGDLKLHLELFRKEQDVVNHRLQRLIDRGESLKIEDLRRLESAKARERRKVERRILRQDVERLLSHFKKQRQR
jgi:hypothetical protein